MSDKTAIGGWCLRLKSEFSRTADAIANRENHFQTIVLDLVFFAVRSSY